MPSNFHQKLGQYIRNKEGQNATDVVLQELAICLTNDKGNFVEILNNAGIPASVEDSDVVLIEKFTQNALANKKLLLGASLLINYRNKVINFDGDEEVSDVGVKNAYNVLHYNFIDEEHSNLVPLLALGGKALGKAINKGGDASKKKADANAKIMAQVLEQRRRQAEEQAKKKAEAKKKTQNIILIGSTAIVLTIIGIIIYKSKK